MLMQDRKSLPLSPLFISLDIGVIRFISDRIGVMYLGKLVEETDTEELFANPLNPYTKGLFASVPEPYIEWDGFSELSGEQPVRTEDFKGCETDRTKRIVINSITQTIPICRLCPSEYSIIKRAGISAVGSGRIIYVEIKERKFSQKII